MKKKLLLNICILYCLVIKFVINVPRGVTFLPKGVCLFNRDATQNFPKYLNILFTLPSPKSALGATEIAVVHCMTSARLF